MPPTAEEEAAAKAAAEEKQQELNLGDKSDAAKAEARAKAAEEKLAKLEAAQKAEADKKTKAEKDAAAAKAIEDGKAKDVISQKETELAAAKERADKLEAAAKARVDKLSEKLSDAAKKRLEMVKEALTIDKLEEFVMLELDAAGTGAATGGGTSFTPGGGGDQNKGEIKFSAEAKEALENIGIEQSSLDKMKTMAKRSINAVTGKGSFTIPIRAMIKDMNARRVNTVPLTKANADLRGGK